MTDEAPHEDVEEESGDAPDTFEDRLVVIVRLIDTADEEEDAHRKLLRRALILRLLSRLLQDTNTKIITQLDRVRDF